MHPYLGAVPPDPPMAPLDPTLLAARVAVGLEAPDKADALRQMVALVAGAPEVADPDRLVADVAAREARMSTGVGGGLALPHARSPAVTGTVAAVATLAAPVDWDALDGAPVDLVVLLAGPEADRAAHVRLLAQVSRVLSAPGVRARLSAAPDADAVRAALASARPLAGAGR